MNGSFSVKNPDGSFWTSLTKLSFSLHDKELELEFPENGKVGETQGSTLLYSTLPSFTLLTTTLLCYRYSSE